MDSSEDVCTVCYSPLCALTSQRASLRRGVARGVAWRARSPKGSEWSRQSNRNTANEESLHLQASDHLRGISTGIVQGSELTVEWVEDREFRRGGETKWEKTGHAPISITSFFALNCIKSGDGNPYNTGTTLSLPHSTHLKSGSW